MASDTTHQYVEWLWLSNVNPDLAGEEGEEWTSYSPEETDMIERAYANDEPRVQLNNYYIDFKLKLQIRSDQRWKRRPVKRRTHDKGMFFDLL